MKKRKGTEVFKNNLYILKKVHQIQPGRILYNTTIVFINAIKTFLFQTFLLRIILNGFQQGIEYEKILYIGLALIAFELIGTAINDYFGEIYGHLSNNKIEEAIKIEILKKSKEIDLISYEDQEFYDIYVKAIEESWNRIYQVMNTLQSVCWSVFYFLTTGIYILFINPIYILFSIVPFLISFFLGNKINRITFDFNNEIIMKSKHRIQYIDRVFLLPDYAKETHLTNVGTIFEKDFEMTMKEQLEKGKKRIKNIIKYKMLSFSLGHALCLFLSFAMVVYQTIVTKQILLGDGFIILNSIFSISAVFQNITESVKAFAEHSYYIGNLKKFLEYEVKIQSVESLPIDPNHFDIELQNVSFKYPSNEHMILKDINFKIKSKEKIALVGENGAGKTTLIKLIMRLYEANEGTILWNGQPINHYDVWNYRDQFKAVFQDFKLFNVSIAENILMRPLKEKWEEELVIEALKKAEIYDKVSSLPLGIHTIIYSELDKNSTNFSGGELQKIALARVFASYSKVVILDEPTSALDPISEYNMYQSMIEACQDKSAIIISHRLSSAILADTIYYLEDGKIIESGSHQELMDKKGKYAKMFQIQAKQYELKEQ